MAAIPETRHATVAAIWQAWEARREDDPDRAYLGASEIGHECGRWLWYRFRWAVAQPWSGRMLRLFDRGQIEEARVIADLRSIGCEVWERDETGQQFRYTAIRGHFGGGLDGVVLGVPEAPKTAHLLEVKTHNAKSFADLVKRGVGAAKPAHFQQMQVYMRMADLERALYVACNKDTDDLYTERIERDRAGAEIVLSRASSIIEAIEPPPGISDDPTHWQCKGCFAHSVCHGTDAPRVNCRTCVHSSVEDAGAWRCAWHKRQISTDEQRIGCTEHRYLPALLSRWAEPIDADATHNIVRYRNKLTGAEFTQPEYMSDEIAACADKALIGDAGVSAMKAGMNAQIVPEETIPAGFTLRWRDHANGRHLGLYDEAGTWIRWVPQTPAMVALATDWTGLTDDLPWEETA